MPDVSCDPSGPGQTLVFGGSLRHGHALPLDLFMRPDGRAHFAVRDDCAFLVRPTTPILPLWSPTFVGYSDQQTLRDLVLPVRRAPHTDRYSSGLPVLWNEERKVAWDASGAPFAAFTEDLAAIGEIAEPDGIRVTAPVSYGGGPIIDWPFTTVGPGQDPQLLGLADHAVAQALWPTSPEGQFRHIYIDGELTDLLMRQEVDLLALP